MDSVHRRGGGQERGEGGKGGGECEDHSFVSRAEKVPYLLSTHYTHTHIHFLMLGLCYWEHQTGKSVRLILYTEAVEAGIWTKTATVFIYTANNFPFMYSQKRFSQASLLKSNYQNRITMFCLKFWYFSCQQQHISKWIKKFSGDSYFQVSTTKMVLWICNFLF